MPVSGETLVSHVTALLTYNCPPHLQMQNFRNTKKYVVQVTEYPSAQETDEHMVQHKGSAHRGLGFWFLLLFE